MQLRREIGSLQGREKQPGPRGRHPVIIGPFTTFTRIINREGFFSLYRGLSAVYTGIIPKMAIRFGTFEFWLDCTSSTPAAGAMSGITEAVLVVTPTEVCKIRMQGQYNSMIDPSTLGRVKYKNIFQTSALIVREEGLKALYNGLTPTVIRQGLNQTVNFTVYGWLKGKLSEHQGTVVQPWQHLLMGGLSGAIGPIINNPIDVCKTRLQKQSNLSSTSNTPKYRSLPQTMVLIGREEGYQGLWKGISARLMRIVPGQAITFMTYEFVKNTIGEGGNK